MTEPQGESWKCSTDSNYRVRQPLFQNVHEKKHIRERERRRSTKPTGSDDHNQGCIWPSLVLSLMFWRVHYTCVDKALWTGVTSPYSHGACSSSYCRAVYELLLLHWWTFYRKLWCSRQIQEFSILFFRPLPTSGHDWSWIMPTTLFLYRKERFSFFIVWKSPVV